MSLHVDAHSPLLIRRPLTEPLTHVIEGLGVPRDQARSSIRELGGFLGSNPNTVARTIEDLKRSGYRPLRPRPEAPEPLVYPGAPTVKGATRETAKGKSSGEP